MVAKKKKALRAKTPTKAAANPSWPYGERKPPLSSIGQAIATLTPERLRAVPIPDGAWNGPDLEARKVVTDAFEALGRARQGSARALAESVYLTHHDETVRVAAGFCRLAIAGDDELEAAFGELGESLAARSQLSDVLAFSCMGWPGADRIAAWLEPLLGRRAFDREQAFGSGAGPGLVARATERPTLDARLLKRVTAKDFPFPFLHHGMPEELDTWGFVVRFERPLAREEAEAVRAAFDGATAVELAMGSEGPWFELSIAGDSFGPGIPASDYREFQKAIDLVLLDAHVSRKLPIAWAAKIGFGADDAKGDAWHVWSVARARFEELASDRPVIALVTSRQRAENEAPRHSLLDLMTSSADDLGVARVRALLASGADLNERDSMGRTPLLVAATLRPPSTEIIACLLDAGADVNAQDRRERTSLHYAAYGDWPGNADAVRLLLARGAHVGATDVHAKTALHRACASADLAVVEILVAAGAPLDARDIHEQTPIGALPSGQSSTTLAIRARLKPL